MYPFNTSDSYAQKVRKVVKSHIETRGEAWLLQLGQGSCNDYAQSVAAIVMCRFETAARNIRAIKADLKKKQPTV